MISFDIQSLDWGKGETSSAGERLLPAIVQDAGDASVLMLGYVSPGSLARTLDTGLMTFWSRSRESLWTKGETSGNYLEVESLETDCDRDTLLVQARPRGPVCHTGQQTCFGDRRRGTNYVFLEELQSLIVQRDLQRPEGSYTTQLFEEGEVEVAKKVGEEAVEVALTLLQDRERTIEESADLIYHLMVFLRTRKVQLAEVLACLRSRHRP